MADKKENGKSVQEIILEGLEKLRAPFSEECVNLKPKPTKAQRDCPPKDKVFCDKCKQYHHPAVIHLSYVGHAALTQRLLEVDPMWDWEPFAIGSNGLPQYDENGGLWIRLKVLGMERIGYGAPDFNEYKVQPDMVKESIGDALRNAAMRFGAALELWHKGELPSTTVGSGQPPAEEQEAPATITKKQMAELTKEFVARGVNVTKFLKLVNIASIEAIPQAQFESVIAKARTKPLLKDHKKPEEKPAEPEKPPATINCPQAPGLVLSGAMCAEAPCSATCEEYKKFKEAQGI